MSLYSPDPPPDSAQPRGARWVSLALYGLVGITAVWCAVSALDAPPSVPVQVYAALGCRNSAQVLILTMQTDGGVLWPDGTVYTVEESTQLLPVWCAKKVEPALAILANADTLLPIATPLLEAARKLDIRRAILSTPVNYRLH